MSRPALNPKAVAAMERRFELRQDAIDLLGLVVAEWTTDPMSVQCFDLRLVQRAKEVVAEMKQLGDFP